MAEISSESVSCSSMKKCYCLSHRVFIYVHRVYPLEQSRDTCRYSSEFKFKVSLIQVKKSLKISKIIFLLTATPEIYFFWAITKRPRYLRLTNFHNQRRNNEENWERGLSVAQDDGAAEPDGSQKSDCPWQVLKNYNPLHPSCDASCPNSDSRASRPTSG